MNVLPRASVWIRHDARRNGPGKYAQSLIGRNERRTRWIIGCGVVLLHILILAFLARVSPQSHLSSEIPSPLVLLDLSPVRAVPNVTTTLAEEQRSKSMVDSGSAERLRQGHAAGGRESGEFDQTPQSSPTGPLIDWSAELDTVAKSEAPALLADWRRKCRDAERRGELLLGCVKGKTPDIWNTHRGPADFLAIGKREANGHIFDNMNDPDRDRSSEPDIIALQKGPHRPVPMAFDPHRDYFTH